MDLNLKWLKQHQLFEPLFCPPSQPSGLSQGKGQGPGQSHAPLEQLQPPPQLTPFFYLQARLLKRTPIQTTYN